MPNPKKEEKTVVLFSEKDRFAFLRTIAYLKAFYDRLFQALDNYGVDTSIPLPVSEDDQLYDEDRRPCIPLQKLKLSSGVEKLQAAKKDAEAVVFFRAMLADLDAPNEVVEQPVDDPRAAIITKLKAYLDQHPEDQVCEGLIAVLHHEKLMLKLNEELPTYSFWVPGKKERQTLSFVAAAQAFLKLRIFEQGFSGFRSELKKLGFFGPFNLHSSEKDIRYYVTQMTETISFLPKGHRVALPTYAESKKKLTQFLSDYHGNDMMKAEVERALYFADNSTCAHNVKLDRLCTALTKLVNAWVYASKLSTQGNLRAQAVSALNGHVSPKHDPLFSFVLHLVEEARCPIALHHAGFEGDKKIAYKEDCFPPTGNVTFLKDGVSADQLIKLSQEVDSAVPFERSYQQPAAHASKNHSLESVDEVSEPESEDEGHHGDEAVSEPESEDEDHHSGEGLSVLDLQLDGADDIDEYLSAQSESGSSGQCLTIVDSTDGYLDYSLDDSAHGASVEPPAMFQQSTHDLIARVLTAKGRIKLANLLEKTTEHITEIIAHLSDYARYGVGNQKIAVELLKQLNERVRVNSASARREVENVWQISGGLSVGLSWTVEGEPPQYYQLENMMTHELNSRRTIKKIYEIHRAITILSAAKPTGYGSRCRHIINSSLKCLEEMKLTEADFKNVKLVTLSGAFKQLAKIVEINTESWSEAEQSAMAYCAQQLKAIFTQVQLFKPRDQREALSILIDQLLDRWERAIEPVNALANLAEVFNALRKLNEQISYPAARGKSKLLGREDDQLVDSGVAESAVNYAILFDCQPDSGLPVKQHESSPANRVVTYQAGQLNNAVYVHDDLSLKPEADYCQKHVLTNHEKMVLKGLVGRHIIAVHQYPKIQFSYAQLGDGPPKLYEMYKELVDICQGTALAGDVRAPLLEQWLVNLFDEIKAPSFDEQLQFIKQDFRFKYVSLKLICALDLDSPDGPGYGVSLIDLYRALKLEKLIKDGWVKEFDHHFANFSPYLQANLKRLQAEITRQLPKSCPDRLLTYKGLVDELLTDFSQRNRERQYAERYPDFCQAILGIVVDVENNRQAYPNRELKAKALCERLYLLIKPYLTEHQTYNSAVVRVLNLIELTDRRFSRSITHDDQVLTERIRAHLNVPPVPAERAQRLFEDKTAQEAKFSEPLDPFDLAIADDTQHQTAVRVNFRLFLPEDLEVEDINLDARRLHCQVINLTGKTKLNMLNHHLVDGWGKAIRSACRSYYTRSSEDCLVGSPRWRTHARILETSLILELNKLTVGTDLEIKEKCRAIICRSPGFSKFDINDLNENQQQDLAKSMLMYQHVDAMISDIESESLPTRSDFLTNLKNIRSTMKMALLDSSDFRCIEMPTWQASLTQLHHIFEEMEHRFTPDNNDHSNINVYRERLYETAQLRLQLLDGLKSIQSDELLENDHDRLTAFSKMLVAIIKEFLSGPVSSFNKEMIHKLIVLNENIRRAVSLNNDAEHSGVAGDIKKIALRGVVKLEVDEARQMMTKLKHHSQGENSPAEINDIIFEKRFSYSDTSLDSAAQQQFTRLSWLTAVSEKSHDEHHHLPAMYQSADEHPTESNELLPEPIDSSALYYAKNAVRVKAFLANDQATSDLLECLRIKSERYSRVNTGYKFHRAFRSLAIQVARQVAEIMAADEVDYVRLTQHRYGYVAFLSDVSHTQQLNLMKLLAAENVVANALEAIDRSGLYVKNSEYRAILKRSLEDIHSHLPEMAMMNRKYQNYTQVRQAILEVFDENMGPVYVNDSGLLELKGEIEQYGSTETSMLCKHVADKLVGLINESYQPGFFASRTNKYLNNQTVLALFMVVEQVEHPIARGDLAYFEFSSDYLFKRLRYQINSVVMKDPQAAEECCRVRHLLSQSVA